MNRIEHTLTEQDLLRLNLYYASISPNFRKQRARHRTLFPVIDIIIALLFFRSKNYAVGTGLIVFAAGWYLLYPAWLLWFYRRHIKKQIAETMGDVLPRQVVLEIQPDGIFTSSRLGESKFKFDAIDRIVEDDGYTYVFIGKGMSIILPHDRIPKDARDSFVDEIKRRKANAGQRNGDLSPA